MKLQIGGEKLSYNNSSQRVFENLSFSISTNEKIGLVGFNGCGKSTLLKAIYNNDFTEGTLSFSKSCNLAHIQQDISNEDACLSVEDFLSKEYENFDKWQFSIIMQELQIENIDFSKIINTFSEGQKTKLLIAKAIYKQPNVLLLDEPSNHLDITTIIWLENFLKLWNGSFILVSHDERLLNNVTSSTWILRNKHFYSFKLSFIQAIEKLEETDNANIHTFSSKSKEINRLEKSAKRLAYGEESIKVRDFQKKQNQCKRTLKRKKKTLKKLIIKSNGGFHLAVKN